MLNLLRRIIAERLHAHEEFWDRDSLAMDLLVQKLPRVMEAVRIIGGKGQIAVYLTVI